MSSYIECVGIGKDYPIKLGLGDSLRSIISKNRYDSKSYQALSNISFELEEGDRLGVIGTNGSGKSTLLKILGGIIKPSTGYILTRGKSTAILEPNNLLYKELTGLENIKIVGRLLGIDKSTIADNIDEIIQFSEIGPYIHQPVRYYSSGMLLRLTMSIYKYLQPDVLLLDEVLSVGDVSFRAKIFETFKNDFSKIPVMVLVSHEMSDIVSFCNKCIYLRDGELLHFGDINSVYEQYSLEHLGKKVNKEYEEKISLGIDNNEQIIFKKHSEKISFSFKLSIKDQLKNFHMVFYLSNSSGPLITDSLVFRNGEKISINRGDFLVTISIPSNLLNKGDYFSNIVILDDLNLVAKFALNRLSILPDDWELNKDWNVNPAYPIRPKLNWEINSLE